MSTGYFSVKETSEMLGYSEQYVRKLLRSGELSGELISNRWVIASESANEYRYKENEPDSDVPDHERRSSSKPTLKALSFFSGCMGLDLGLEKEGIDVILACEV